LKKFAPPPISQVAFILFADDAVVLVSSGGGGRGRGGNLADFFGGCLGAETGELNKLDAFAGLDDQKQWMLLFLNNTELRPGGGFMGVYGLMQVSEGSIEQIYIDDTYTIAAKIENLICKIQKTDKDKIQEVTKLIKKYVDVDTILNSFEK